VLAFDWTSVPAAVIYLGGLAAAALAIIVLSEKIRSVLRPRRGEEMAGQTLISVFPGPGIHGSASRESIAYTVPLRNVGDAVAANIRVELVDAQKKTVGTGGLIEHLVPGERAFATVITPPRDRYTGPYEVFFEWDDGRGQQRVASGVEVGAP
jgi:hypothetical protein